MKRPSLAFVIGVALMLPILPAHGDDDDDEGASPALNLSNVLGLTGFKRMIDARVPVDEIAVRGGVFYNVSVRNRDFEGAVDASLEQVEHQIGIAVGASALGLVDAAARIPYVIVDYDLDVEGLPDVDESDQGWGDLELGAKVSLSLIDLSFASLAFGPYLTGGLPTGEPEVEDLWEAEWGATATLGLFNEYLSVHANVGGYNREGGVSGVKLRVGLAFVAWADHNALIRVYAYTEGIEYTDSAEADLDVDFGVQAIVLEFITIELSAAVRVFDGGDIEADTQEDLEAATGVVGQSVRDQSDWDIQLSIGFVF